MKHLFSKGHSSLFPQVHLYCFSLSGKTFLLCVACQNGAQPFGKCRLTNFRNCFPTLLFTLLEYGGLNQIIFRFHLFFSSLPCLSPSSLTYSSFSWNPLFFRASSYMGIDSLNICSLEDVSEILLLTDFANCRRTVGG